MTNQENQMGRILIGFSPRLNGSNKGFELSSFGIDVLFAIYEKLNSPFLPHISFNLSLLYVQCPFFSPLAFCFLLSKFYTYN